MKTIKKQERKFITGFIGVTGMKLMVYLIFIVIFAFVKRNFAVQFLITFLTLYIIFSVVEVITSVKYLKKSK